MLQKEHDKTVAEYLGVVKLGALVPAVSGCKKPLRNGEILTTTSQEAGQGIDGAPETCRCFVSFCQSQLGRTWRVQTGLPSTVFRRSQGLDSRISSWISVPA